MKFRRRLNNVWKIIFSLFWVLSCSAFWPFSCVSSSPTPSFLFLIIVGSAVNYCPVGGQSLSLVAIGLYSDGTQGNLTQYVNWAVNNPSLGSIDSNGLFTSASTGGIVQITATDPTSGITSEPYNLNVTGLITTVKTTTSPTDAYVRPGSNEVWVVSRETSGAVYVIDTTSNTVTSTLTPPGGQIPGSLVFLPNGSKAYLSTSTTSGILAINANAKTFGATFATNTGSVNMAVSPDGASVFYAETNTSAGHAKGVYKINTTSDTETLFSNSYVAPTGLTILGNGQLYVSDYVHTVNGLIYAYPSYSATSGSSSFQLSNWTPDALSASGNGSFVFATGASSPPSYVILSRPGSSPQPVQSDYGKLAYFNDNQRALWARMSSQDFSVVDFTASPPQLVETISQFPAGLAAISSSNVLYLPSLKPNRVDIYQYY